MEIPTIASLRIAKNGALPSTEELQQIGAMHLQYSRERLACAEKRAKKRKAEEAEELTQKVTKLITTLSRPMNNYSLRK